MASQAESSESRVRFMPVPPLGLLLLLLGLLLLLVSLRIHGFSLPVWHEIIDESPADEILIGKARRIRGDEWFVRLPLAFGQAAHDPPFPRTNRNIGLGQDLILPLRVPIAHPIAMVRPTLWGFFIENDLGMAWMWWSRIFGLFAVWTWVFLILTGGRLGLSVLGAILLPIAPLFQFWALQAVPVTLFAGLTFIGAVGVLEARTRGGIVAGSLVLGWAGSGLLLELYPPYQVVLGYLVLALLVGHLWQRGGGLARRERLVSRLLSLGLAGLIGLGASAAFYLDASDAIHRMLQTVYPGHRVSTGGDYPLWRLLSNNLWITLRVSGGEGVLREANWGWYGAFWLFSPVLAASALYRRFRSPGTVDRLSTVLFAFVGLLLVYCLIGFPSLLARGLLLSWMPGPRAMLGLGLADAALLVLHLAGGNRFMLERKPAVVIAASWCVLLAACAAILHERHPELGLVATTAIVLLNGWIAYALLRVARPALTLAIVAGGLAACSLWFNPVVRGGSEFLVRNPLSQQILAIDRAEGGNSFWVNYGSHQMGNLFRVLGVRALNGVHPLPQLSLWHQLDPEGRYRTIYNRFAHVNFEPARSSRVSFRLVGPDGFTVRSHPAGAPLRALGVTHVLVRSRDPRVFDDFPGLERLFSVGRNHIYRIRRNAAVSPARSRSEAVKRSSPTADDDPTR